MVQRMLVRTAILVFLVGLCASIQMLAAEPEWLSLCGQCVNPSVTAKSGIGTDKAVIDAKVTRDDAARWCNNFQPGPNAETCIQGQLANDSAKKIYRATADCTLGRMTGIDGKAYTLAGQWTAGEGKGRTTWRNAAGSIVGQDNASGGLAIAQQWEILCPGPIQASARAAVQQAAPRAAAFPSSVPPPAPVPLPVCGGKAYCTEVASFAATIADFGTSVSGGTRYLTATIRFQNKTNNPLILGYQDGSGIAVDDQGNRYGIAATTVRGIGIISTTGRELDAKFRLNPGESRDARLEFNWTPSSRDIFGTTYKADLTIREIIAIPNTQQFRQGGEYPLSFNKLAAQTASLPPATSPAATTSAPAPKVLIPDACAGIQRCFSTGPFTAEVTQVVPSQVSNAAKDQELLIRLKVRNVSDQPLVLDYVSRSASAIDDKGNRYVSDSVRNPAQGIPVLESTGGGVNSNFTLKPGEIRSVTFQLLLARTRNSIMGMSYNFTTTLGQLEVLPGKQLRSTGEYVVSFPGLVASAGKPSTVGACAGIQRCDDAGPFTMDITQISAAQVANAAKDQTIQMTVRFRNVSGQPIILTHVATTSLMIDNNGNQYVSVGQAAKGIPVSGNNGPVDPAFSLKPGESRTATFQVFWDRPTGPLGKSFSWFVAIEQWDSVQSQVVSAGQYALAFPGLTASGPSLLNILRQAVPTK